ncbi:MAG: hypothetical protein Q8P87_01215 [bacterium]|nr:hypothetical protein [bacterium]
MGSVGDAGGVVDQGLTGADTGSGSVADGVGTKEELKLEVGSGAVFSESKDGEDVGFASGQLGKVDAGNGGGGVGGTGGQAVGTEEDTGSAGGQLGIDPLVVAAPVTGGIVGSDALGVG